ncbi:MAG: NADP-dependent malic enzyme [Alphaproteobacteria bacterium]|jgi:malate dehydrogenase (oxaloacetate-decarboxylating)(NADP+)|nr:NADP-dependent malic enzyme [Alphaproteobacteria bacterium]QQS56711.1 MAG: NADP-dependent malic enzyme [Alphaproteobacteria bacterium]
MSSKKDKEAFRQSALDYHKYPTPGKIAIRATKEMSTQRDLALAYSPGVAAPCEEIARDPATAYDYTSRGNLVAVISNGTAVLGLGDLGALASKPVMEGKAVLFKKFANIDSVDIEIDATDVDKVVEIVAALEPTFGGINLEDFKAPECFEIETRLKERMKIPVFHDDQHGTAIIVTAAFTNWIKYSKRKIGDIKLVASGAGASAIACLNLLVHAGLKKENILVSDRNGIVYEGRKKGMDPAKVAFAAKTNIRTLEEALVGADVFLGLSGPGVLNKELVSKMADAPLILALANPTPEIMPEEAYAAKPNAIVCTGRSDFPNQVNNVLCFPFIFRGALDVGATTINEEMKLACVKAIAELAQKEIVAEVAAVYSNENLEFGRDYLIPKPFDPRLIVDLPLAVAKAAMDSGVATRPITDFEAYRDRLQQYFIRSRLVMRPIYSRAKENPKRVVYSEGEEERVLQAAQTVIDENLAHPILIGREKVIETRIKRLGLRMHPGKHFTLIDPSYDPRYKDYWQTYHSIMERRGTTPDDAKAILRNNTTVIGALMVYKDDADAVICGTLGHYHEHLEDIIDIIGLKPGVETPAALSPLLLSAGTFFFCDTQINANPTVAQISEMTLMAAEEVRRFGIKPKVALLSHSNFGTIDTETSRKMRAAFADIRRRDPDLEIDGEMQADVALSESVRERVMPNSRLNGQANLFIMPNVESANITFNMLRTLSDGVSIGPLLLGAARPAHILTPSVTARGIINITSIATVGAQIFDDSVVDHTTHRLIRSA